MTIHTTATRYAVSALPNDHRDARHLTINVEYRGRGLWAVSRYSECLGTDGDWDYESIPSERGDEWLAAHRFDLETALRLAEQAAPGLTINGLTVADVLAITATGATS